MSCGDILRRRLVAIATDRFEAFPPLKGVPEEVRTLRAWLCDPRLGDRAFDDTGFAALAQCPSREDVEQALNAAGFNDGDAVFVYVTGHGQVEMRAHWTALRTSQPGQLARTALETLQLVRLLATHKGLEQVMLVIDLCEAGDVAEEIVRAFQGMVPQQWIVLLTTGAGARAKVGVFTSAVRDVIAGLAAGSERDASPIEPHLRRGVFLEPVLQRLREKGQRPILLSPDPYGVSCCLPNPKYDPGAAGRASTEPARRDLAVLAADMAAHWGPRSRGVASEVAGEWLFTGREGLMDRLIRFATGAPGTLVVSGRPGSGKSAVLSRLVTCSDPIFRAEHIDLIATARPVPPEGAVHIGVLATGKSAFQIAMQIARALGVPGAEGMTDLEALVPAIVTAAPVRPEDPPTIVLDALDEAADPAGVVLTLLRRLNPRSMPQFRLMIGVRSAAGAAQEPAPAPGPAVPKPLPADPADLASVTARALGAEVVAVDGDAWWHADDLRGYVSRILTRQGSPYAAMGVVEPDGLRRHPRAEDVAGAIEHASGRSFLLASLVANQLAAQAVPIGADDPRLRAMLEGGIAETLRADLEASFPATADRERTILLLRATALAFGRGLPWRDVWAPVASALAEAPGVDAAAAARRPLDDGDVERLLGHRLGGYLVRDLEDGVTVYRPFHDALGERLAREPERFLRTGAGGALRDAAVPVGGLAGQAAHASIARRLRGMIRDGATPPPYVRRHLVEHAAAAGMLDESVLTTETMPWLDAETLSQALRLTEATPDSMQWLLLTAWRGIRHRWSFEHPDANAAGLDFALWAAAGFSAPTRRAASGLVFHPRWVQWSWGGTVAASDARSLRGVAFGPVANRSVLAVAESHQVRLWDAATGSPIGDPLEVTPDLWAVAMEHLDGATLIAAAGNSETVTIWDAATGQLVQRLPSGPVRGLALGRISGLNIAVTGDQTGLVRIRDVVGGTDVLPPIAVGQPVRALAMAGDPSGGLLLAVGCSDGTVSRWRLSPDLSEGLPAGPPIELHEHVNSVALRTERGSSFLAIGTAVGAVHVFDPFSGQKLGHGTPHQQEVRAVALGRIGETTVLAEASLDGTVGVYHPAGLTPLNDPLPHPESVQAVAFGVVDGRHMLATGCVDGTTRLWDPLRPSGARVQVAEQFARVAFLRHGPDALVAAGASRGVVRAWDANTGVAMLDGRAVDGDVPGLRLRKSAPSRGERQTTPHVALATAPDGPVVVSALGPLVRVFRLADSRAVWEWDIRHPGSGRSRVGVGAGAKAVLPLSLGTSAGRPGAVILSHRNSHLDLFELDLGAVGGRLLAEHRLRRRPEHVIALTLPEEMAAGSAPATGPVPKTPRGARRAPGRTGKSARPDGSPLLALVYEDRVTLFDARLGAEVITVPRPRWSGPIALGLLEGQGVLATWGDEGVQLWDLERGRSVGRTVEVAGAKTGLALTRAGGRDVIVTGHHATIRIWNPWTGRLVTHLPFGTPIEALAVARDGDRDALEIAVVGAGVGVVQLHASEATMRPPGGQRRARGTRAG